MSVDLMIPREPRGTLGMLASGRSTPLDTALVDGRLSFLVIGIGPDGAAVREVAARRRGPIRKIHYLRAILHTLITWRPEPLRVEIDGEPIPESFAWVLVSNVIGYGGLFRLCRDRRLDDGRWEVYLFPRGSRWALLGYSLRAMLLGLPGGDCRMRLASRVSLRAAAPVPIEIDGDYAGESERIEIEVQPGPFTLLLP
jgi:diacylglycerol kinase family enzyme